MRKLILIFGLLCATLPARAQNYVTPANIANNGATTPILNAVSAPGRYAIGPVGGYGNIGQTFHYGTYTTSSSTARLWVRMEGCATSCNLVSGAGWTPISGDATEPGTGAIFGVGQFPYLAVNLIAAPSTGTITFNYVGTSAAPSILAGVFTQTQAYPRVIAYGANLGTTNTYIITPPFGSAGGRIYFQFRGFSQPTGATLVINVGTAISSSVYQIASLSMAANGGLQYLDLPAASGDYITAVYTAGAGGSGTYDIQYYFNAPGATSGIPNCAQSATFTISGTVASTLAISLPFVAPQSTRICNLSISSGGASSDTQLIQGTGSTCGSGATNLTGVYALAVNGNVSLAFQQDGLVAAPGDNVCIVTTNAAGATVSGTITYSQF
jgi:hypothetical protein